MWQNTKLSNMFRASYWEKTTFLREADVLIVGAGLTGLQAALELKRQNLKLNVLVIERAPLPRGASTRNAGFACFGGPTELLADLDAYGPESMVDTVRQRYAGIRALEENYAGRGIDWHKCGGYEIVEESASRNTAEVQERLKELNDLLAEVTGRAETWSPVNFSDLSDGAGSTISGVFHNPMEAQLHPGKLVTALLEDGYAAGVRFLFGAKVVAVEEGRVEVEDFGTLKAERILLTVNAFAREFLPEDFPESIRPVRNQILLSRKIPNLKIQGCFHFHEGYVYFRNVGNDRLLIGGARHLAGAASETDVFGANEAIAETLVASLQRWFPEYGLTRADFPDAWSGIIAQGDGKEPVLRFARPNVLIAGRLAGMGVALSAALARRAAKLLLAE